MKFSQGRRCVVGVFGERDICDQFLCIHICVSGEENTPLVPAGEPADFLPQLPLEEHWDEDLPYVLLCLLLLIYRLLTTIFCCRVLWQSHVLPPLPQVYEMCQVPGDVLGTNDPLLVTEDDNEKH